MAGVCAVEDPGRVRDPEYVAGLEDAVSEVIGFAIEAIGQATPPPLPVALYPQARLAARNGVSFGTVARRYMEGYLALDGFVEQEAAADHASRLRHTLRLLLRDLVKEADQAYHLEAGRHGAPSRESRRVKLAEELLAGAPVDPGELAPGFDFDSWHVGLVATGASAVAAVALVAKAAGCRFAQVRPGGDSVWGWVTARSRLNSAELQLLAAERMPKGGCLALGEPGYGRYGWQLSHGQAAAALRVGLRRGDRIVRYDDVALEASLLQDSVRAASLRQRYLIPLEGERDGGEKSLETLHAYFNRDRNKEATAIALGGLARQTVSYRLRKIEKRLDCELHACAHDLEAALALHRLDRGESAPGP